jgi:hypothetical protein
MEIVPRRHLSHLFVLAAACQVSTDILDKRTYFCDGTALTETCGTTSDGTAMTCYQARQIGARDFCTQRCLEGDPDASGDGWRCVDTRAKLRGCRPSEGASACSLPGTECLRTDGLKDEGVCITMSTCSEDAQCRDPARPTCMGTLVTNWYGTPAAVHPDHWSCLQTGCRARNSGCAAGESCLPSVFFVGSEPLDICVPNCDVDLNCPPNYLCLRKVSGPAAPQVCLPGIMGFRCLSDMDCLLGDCRDTGDGWKVCAMPCASDDDCARFGAMRGPFVCAPDPGGRGKFCQNPRAYAGSSCFTDDQCRPHESCVLLSPWFASRMFSGECRARCGPDLPCKDRGGVPHVCVELGGAGTCYPGRIHMPCEEDADCVGNLKCLEVTVPDRQDQFVRKRRCSTTCRTSADCAANRFTENFAYCHGEGRCTARRHLGVLCEVDDECEKSRCLPSADPVDQQMGRKRCQ